MELVDDAAQVRPLLRGGGAYALTLARARARGGQGAAP